MSQKWNLLAITAASLSLFYGDLSYATEPGNAYYAASANCPGVAGNGKIVLGSFTLGNGHQVSYVYFRQYNPSSFTTDLNPVEEFAFDMTAGTYSILTPGSNTSIPGLTNFSGSGTFTGSITANIFGGTTLNLTLSCGATLIGGTEFPGE